MKIAFFHSYGPLLLAALIGAALGAALGYYGQCTSGTCPLTSTWWRGAIYGGAIGLMFGVSSISNERSREQNEGPSGLNPPNPQLAEPHERLDADK